MIAVITVIAVIAVIAVIIWKLAMLTLQERVAVVLSLTYLIINTFSNRLGWISIGLFVLVADFHEEEDIKLLLRMLVVKSFLRERTTKTGYMLRALTFIVGIYDILLMIGTFALDR